MRASYHGQAPDDALVAGLAVGDGDAATELVRRFQASVFGLALAVTRERTLAEDVAQEAFVRAWRAASTYDGRRGSVSAWLLTITRNAAIDAVRARRQLPADREQLDALLHALQTGEDPADTATARIESQQAVQRLRRLPAEQGRAVALAVFAGCTAAEVGEHEGIPLGTAKTRIRTGLRRLRQPGTLEPGARGTPAASRQPTGEVEGGGDG